MNADTLSDRLGPSLAVDEGGAALMRVLVRLLALGEPVSIEAAAAALGRSPEHVRGLLGHIGGIERDERGAIIAAGLSLRETPHVFEVGGKRLYTWCALDTLMFPIVLDDAAVVESPCAATGVPVRVTVSPGGLGQVVPAQAVVSIAVPEEGGCDLRGAFCNHVHFFASREAAATWLTTHPSGFVASIADAFELGRHLASRILGGLGRSCC
jgi:alkylmercury lyase